MHVRWMIERDLPYLQQFDSGWTADDWASAKHPQNRIGMVAEKGNDVLGAMVYSFSKTRFDVFRFRYATEDAALSLIAKLYKKLMNDYGRKSATMLVEESQFDLACLLKSQGWRCVAHDGETMRFVLIKQRVESVLQDTV
jgi:ribosomal-protein-alanine N-acetyltransferase